MMPFDDPTSKVFDGPPPSEYLIDPLTNLPKPTREPVPQSEQLPDVVPMIDEVSANPSAKMTDQIGQALRAGLGIGALALLPDLIADLRRTKDPDSRLKFMAMAIKEGGYGTKEDKTANLPVFHFNFVGSGGEVTVHQVPQDQQIEDATYTVQAPTPVEPAPVSAAAVNADVQPNELESIFDLIDQT